MFFPFGQRRMSEARTLRVPEDLREQHIVSLITDPTDRVERSGHIGDMVSRAMLIPSL